MALFTLTCLPLFIQPKRAKIIKLPIRNRDFGEIRGALPLTGSNRVNNKNRVEYAS